MEVKKMGKYAITATHKGRRKVADTTFSTKAKAKKVLKRYLKSKKRKESKNPRVVRIKGYRTKSKI